MVTWGGGHMGNARWAGEEEVGKAESKGFCSVFFIVGGCCYGRCVRGGGGGGSPPTLIQDRENEKNVFI